LRRSTQRGHAIGFVFGLPLRDALDRPGQLLVMLRQVRPATAPGVRRPLPMLRRRHQEG